MDISVEVWLRFSAFIAVFVTLAICERFWPRRANRANTWQRWTTNLSILAIDGLFVRLLATLTVPIAAVAAGVYATRHELGVLPWLGVPSWLNWVISNVMLDFAIWLQHLISHKVPLFWRLHQVHHTDVDLDVSTALRFHPIEIVLSVVWKVICVLFIGAEPVGVIIFEILLNATAMITHANIAIPGTVDKVIRKVFVTPEMHRIHHSVVRADHDSNYGFNLAIWDRLFGTYTANPRGGPDGGPIGLDRHQNNDPTRLIWSLLLPFQRPK